MNQPEVFYKRKNKRIVTSYYLQLSYPLQKKISYIFSLIFPFRLSLQYLSATMQWSNDLTNELFKPSRKKFQRRRVVSLFVDHIWATDLLDLQRYSRVNKGYKYILVVVDVFSKYAWLKALKTKKGVVVAKAFKEIIRNSNNNIPPKFLWSDRGTEYYNTFVKQVLRQYGIHHYSTYNTEKCVIAERFNRTIRSWLEKYFDTNEHTVWYNILDRLEEKYNSTVHRSIGLPPIIAR